VFLVYGCGGSDGDGSSGISNTPAPTQTATVTRSVSGNIVPDTDTIIPAVVSAADNQLTKSGSGTILDNATSIEITSYDNSSNVIDKTIITPKTDTSLLILNAPRKTANYRLS